MCYVSDSDLNLLGLDWIEQLRLQDLPIRSICNHVRSVDTHGDLSDHITRHFAPVFQSGLGQCTRAQATLHLRAGSQPVFWPKRPLPYSALPLVDKELQRLEQLGVLNPVTADDIRNATAQEPTLVQVMEYVRSRWPNAKLSGEIHQLFLRRESLAVVDFRLMFADRIVVPRSLRRAVLHQFHSGHPGTSRMKAIARGFAYWPGMDDDISESIKRCSKCPQAAKLPKKQDPVPWDLPKGPWSRIHLNFAGPINRVMYLIVVDAYSKWPEIVPLHPATSSNTIAALQKIFSQHGIPEILVSDNGSQFSSAQFRNFCSRSNIQHGFSPPYHPQSNGQAERFVHTLKRAFLKSRGEGTMDEILQNLLLVYRSTPNPAAPDGRSHLKF